MHKLFSSFAILAFTVLIVSCHTHKHNELNKHSTNSGYFGPYSLDDPKYGTKTTVKIENGLRKMATNALPNHETGSFPNEGNPNTISAQDRSYEFPLQPKYTGNAKWARQPGVALNGVKFEPQTAEVVQCESGENYRVEAVQELIDMGLDYNHAHVQPTGAYHYHGTPTEVVSAFDTGEDLVHIGFAMDGFPIYFSKSSAYKPSYQMIDESREGTDCVYENPHVQLNVNLAGTDPDGTYISDWEYVPDLGDLDECNGLFVDGEYVYLVTDDYPYVGRCLKGEYEEPRRRGPPPGGRRTGGQRPQGPPPGGRG